MLPTSLKSKNPLPAFFTWMWALGLVLGPLGYIVFISFMNRGTYGGVVFTATLQNYIKIFDPALAPLILMSLLRSLLMAFITTLACLFIGLPLAMFMVFRSGKYRQVLFFLLLIPFWTQFLIRVYAWMTLFSDNGVINSLFGVNWLFTYKAVFVGMLYNYLPYMVMSLYVNLEKFDKLLLEASADLGASNFTTFFKVILPIIKPGIITGSIMVFIPALGEFVIPDVLGGGKTFFVGNLLTQQFLFARNWPFGASLSVVFILLVVLSFFIFSKVSKDSKVEDLL